MYRLLMRQEYRKEAKVSRQAGFGAVRDLRANQKERTRAALVAAADALVRRGTPPTVAEAAEAAKVSRATAYRYFPTQESLLVEVLELAPAVAPVEAALAALPAGGDPTARLLHLLDTFNPIAFANEASMRTALRAYLDAWFEGRRGGDAAPQVREGRRQRWLDEALAPVRAELAPRQWRRLRAALSLTIGSEALIVMKDVCRLNDRDALEVLRWAALAILRGALQEGRAGARAPSPARSRRAESGLS